MKKFKNDEGLLYRAKKSTKKAFFYNTNINIVDNTSAVIENCKHILECNEIMVKIMTYEFEVVIWGEGLSLNDYNSSNIVINGRIKSIEIQPKRKGINDDI